MPRKRLAEDAFNRIKKMTNVQKSVGYTNADVAELMGVSAATVSRVSNCADYDDYVAKLRERTCIPVQPEDESKYRFEVVITEGLAICRMYKGDELIKQGHGHIFRDGDEGVAQAVSYGFKRLYYHFLEEDEEDEI